MIEQNDMDNRFTYHPPTEDRATMHVMLREHGRAFADLVNEMLPDGREKSLAVTKIEEAVMWANAGLARSPEEG